MEVRDVLFPRLVAWPPLDPKLTSHQRYKPCLIDRNCGRLPTTSKRSWQNVRYRYLTVVSPWGWQGSDFMGCDLVVIPISSCVSLHLLIWLLMMSLMERFQWTNNRWPPTPHPHPHPQPHTPPPQPRFLNSTPTGLSSFVNSRGEVANPKGRQVNWYVLLLTTNRKYFWWTPGFPSWSVAPPCAGSAGTNLWLNGDLLSSSAPGTAGCRTQERTCWELFLWLPWTTAHPQPAADPGSCSWCEKWCSDGWVEVDVEKVCPPPPRQCWWPGRSPANFATVGQSLPGELLPATHQRRWAEEAEAAPLAFLRWAGTGCWWAPLPAPA